MANRTVSTITRTVTISDLTPVEMASIFAEWHDDDQAAFFAALRAESAGWPGSGWCGQAHAIVEKLSDDGIFTLGALAGHLHDRIEGTPE